MSLCWKLQEKMKHPKIMDFGGWVRLKLKNAEKTPSDLSRVTGIPYPSLDRILKASERGKFVQPKEDTIAKISKALVDLNVIEDEREAWVAAGFLADGYQVVKDGLSVSPPENFTDWPADLQQALAHTRTLTPNAQVYIYKLWLEQSRAHADIEERRKEAERKLEERELLLRHGK